RLIARLVGVVQPVLDGARRHRGHEGLRRRGALQRGLEVRDVPLDLSLPDVGEGPGAEKLLPLAAGADHPAVDRGPGDAGVASEPAMLLKVPGELAHVAAGDADRGARLSGLHLARLEAAQPLARVVAEVRLAELAIVENVH